MEILCNIFKITLCIVGIIISLEVLYACTIGLFLTKRKKDKAIKEIQELAEECMKEIIEEEKAKKETPKKPRNTKKSEEK